MRTENHPSARSAAHGVIASGDASNSQTDSGFPRSRAYRNNDGNVYAFARCRQKDNGRNYGLHHEKSRYLFVNLFVMPEMGLQRDRYRQTKSTEILRFQCFSPAFCAKSHGGDSRDRTGDLLNAIQALSQLSYTPMLGARVTITDSFRKCKCFFRRDDENAARRVVAPYKRKTETAGDFMIAPTVCRLSSEHIVRFASCMGAGFMIQ